MAEGPIWSWLQLGVSRHLAWPPSTAHGTIDVSLLSCPAARPLAAPRQLFLTRHLSCTGAPFLALDSSERPSACVVLCCADSLPLESLPPHPPHRSPGGRVPTPPPTSSPACSFLPFLCLFSALLCTLWQGAAPALQRPGAQQAAGEEESASLQPEAPPRGGLIPLEPAGRRGRARRRPRRLQTGARPGAGSARHVSSRGLAVTPVAGAAMAAALAAAIELLPLVATPVVGQGKAAPPGVAGWTCARTAARVGGSGSGAGFATVQAAVARAC